MTKEHLLLVINMYLSEMIRRRVQPLRGEDPLQHAAWMLTQMKTFVADDRLEKAQRWLGVRSRGSVDARRLHDSEDGRPQPFYEGDRR